MRVIAMLATMVLAADAAGAQSPVEITNVEAVVGTQTMCPNAPQTAHRYFLSNGRTVLLCGPLADDPVRFINDAGIYGLVVEMPPAEPLLDADVATVAMAQPDQPPVLPVPVDQVAVPVVPREMSAPVSAVSPPAPAPIGRCRDAQACYVQLGAFARVENVTRAQTALEKMGFPVSTRLLTLRSGRVLMAVLAGPMSAKQARTSVIRIRNAGFHTAVLR